eukprot:10164973-Lingulodinium_polyedra.AAC.1
MATRNRSRCATSFSLQTSAATGRRIGPIERVAGPSVYSSPSLHDDSPALVPGCLERCKTTSTTRSFWLNSPCER